MIFLFKKPTPSQTNFMLPNSHFNVQKSLQTGWQHQMKQTGLLYNTVSYQSQHWKWIFVFIIKFIWLGVGFLNRKIIFYYLKNLKIPNAQLCDWISRIVDNLSHHPLVPRVQKIKIRNLTLNPVSNRWICKENMFYLGAHYSERQGLMGECREVLLYLCV